jgi:hypothetical protein
MALLQIRTLADENCNGSAKGNAKATVVGGNAPYTYNWSNGSTSNPTGTVLSRGTYTITITDSTGCTASASVTITQAALAIATSASPDTICKGNTTTITATPSGVPPYQYMWSNGLTTSSFNISLTSSTTYTVTATDSTSCSGTASISIIIDVPNISINPARYTVCVAITKDSLIAVPAGGTFSGTGVTGHNFNPNTAGVGSHWVKYTYTDTRGCTNTDSVKITVNTCLGIPGINGQDNQVALYPSPSNGKFTIEWGAEKESAKVEIYNMIGEKVYAGNINSVTTRLDLSDQPQGVYLYRIMTEKGDFVSEGKFIIQK